MALQSREGLTAEASSQTVLEGNTDPPSSPLIHQPATSANTMSADERSSFNAQPKAPATVVRLAPSAGR
jgi:hypothetical protein